MLLPNEPVGNYDGVFASTSQLIEPLSLNRKQHFRQIYMMNEWN